MTKSGSNSEYEGMELLLTKGKRIVIKSKMKPKQRIIIWTDPNNNLKAEFIQD